MCRTAYYFTIWTSSKRLYVSLRPLIPDFCRCQYEFKPFLANALFLYLLYTQQLFSGVFVGYKVGTLVRSGLKAFEKGLGHWSFYISRVLFMFPLIIFLCKLMQMTNFQHLQQAVSQLIKSTNYLTCPILVAIPYTVMSCPQIYQCPGQFFLFIPPLYPSNVFWCFHGVKSGNIGQKRAKNV